MIDICTAVQGSQLIFIAVNTPAKNDGETSESGFDMTAYENVARMIAGKQRIFADLLTRICYKFLYCCWCGTTFSLLMLPEKSTVPVHTAKNVQAILEANKRDPNVIFTVLSNPGWNQRSNSF